jgi:GntR family transcriptional regulator/MocR family aminotransferase
MIREPRYREIATLLQAQIRAGKLRPGEPLPSSREVAERFKVNRKTVLMAYDELLAEGWIGGEQRKRLAVSRELPSKMLESPASKAREASAQAFDWGLSEEARKFTPAPTGLKSFRWGFPEAGQLPIRELRSCYLDSLKRLNHRMLDYGDPQGWPELLSVTTEHLRRSRGIVDREIFITQGAGEAMWLAATLLLKPGDVVLMEDPGYHLAASLFRKLGARVVPVPVTPQGLDLEALAKAAREHKPRLLFLTPLHQFPTTVTYGPEQRSRIYEIARADSFAILEDDYDHEFHYDGEPQAPFAATDPDQRILYVGTFSKTLFPGIRLGVLAVPPCLKAEIHRLKRLTCRHPDQVTQDAIARWMREGGADRHVRRMRKANHLKRDLVDALLVQARDAGCRIHWQRPSGGAAFWVDIFEDSEAFKTRARQQGFYCISGKDYSLEGRPSTHVRFGFSNVSQAEIREGMKVFTRLLLAD